MAHSKLLELISDDKKLTAFITNISSGYMDIPYIMTKTLEILEDDNPMFNIITDGNKIALCRMMDMYFTDCWALYIDDIAFDKLLNYGKIEVYKVDAPNGLRYATVNEVAQGIKGLIGEYVYPAGEQEYKHLCLLYWSFTGRNYYYRQAGFELEYDESGNVKTLFYTMIQNCAPALKELFDWISVSERYEKAVRRIEKMKKSKGYKYATFEKDEIIEDITIKQLVYNIYRVFPRNSPNPDYRRALALAIKQYKNKQILSPLEVSKLREIYDMHALDKNRSLQIKDSTSEKLKEECELLLKEQYSGKIDPKHFAYTIISTLKKNNYSKCTAKQYSFISNATNLITGKSNEDKPSDSKTSTVVLSDFDLDSSVESLSDAIGHGLFDDEDNE